jgi:hypothetical protein
MPGIYLLAGIIHDVQLIYAPVMLRNRLAALSIQTAVVDVHSAERAGAPANE